MSFTALHLTDADCRQTFSTELVFYNETSPPEGIFLAIPQMINDVSTWSFVSLVGSYHATDTQGSQ